MSLPARHDEPRLSRSHTLNFVGDWGLANIHRICGWLCNEFCNRAGPASRVAIWSIRGGGIEAIHEVQDGQADLCVMTPAALLPLALEGRGLFQPRPTPNLRALAVLPQDDRMLLALAPDLGISSFEELRRRRPPLRIAASSNDGTNLIGYVGRLLMAAHGIDEDTLRSWGGCYVEDTHPRDCLERMQAGTVDAVLQEAVMTPWWSQLIDSGKAVPLPAERAALDKLAAEHGLPSGVLPAGYWDKLRNDLPALDFSDFLVMVRDDMPDEVAHLLTWCLAETRESLERQYRHIPPKRSPVTYPIDPRRMARPPIPLHPGAARYYREAGLLEAPAATA
ncbi:hypothetical protein PIGHUM_03567 [Pigmentiphaga humi]|uniref:NMT1/THI5 like protein n=1 Tax=Pigmentiphaga humi TaxID=2478468 RepID=A0A3P4B5Z3_9BURK|nr:TAXI family TRAP transporter solute-binding subunit [Pigmentiphaga humi]VCU71482.1 hypothetical protein PIGHUM_03567 [Pigmentiphaga humi]